jgi:fatty acid desaturase
VILPRSAPGNKAIMLNRLVFLVSMLGLIGSFVLIVNFDLSQFNVWQRVLTIGSFILINSVFIHTLFNVVHLASHSLLGKKFWVNRCYGNIAAFFGGITFSDFYTTHLLHHAHQGDSEKDPDHWITRSGSIWTIPLKIMYHDVWFWKHHLNERKHLGKDYLATRALQVLTVLAFLLTGNIAIFLLFWLLPMGIVGLMNGLFLFYYPHYSTHLEQSIKENSNPNLFGKGLLEAIDISRISHEVHHDRVRSNEVYYPLSWAFGHMIRGTWTQVKTDAELKYTDFKLG